VSGFNQAPDDYLTKTLRPRKNWLARGQKPCCAAVGDGPTALREKRDPQLRRPAPWVAGGGFGGDLVSDKAVRLTPPGIPSCCTGSDATPWGQTGGPIA